MRKVTVNAINPQILAGFIHEAGNIFLVDSAPDRLKGWHFGHDRQPALALLHPFAQPTLRRPIGRRGIDALNTCVPGQIEDLIDFQRRHGRRRISDPIRHTERCRTKR